LASSAGPADQGDIRAGKRDPEASDDNGRPARATILGRSLLQH
jgi:hypothetical protein